MGAFVLTTQFDLFINGNGPVNWWLKIDQAMFLPTQVCVWRAEDKGILRWGRIRRHDQY